ncbi:precorrin-8X methylmutase [uncultured Cohaesibacter sp.]|uniref:precorrin-8X methylmutase n=1 Tax=uncultured Cohaesibacter sp. TaxID=1002546 RepID=UPI003747F169
MTFDYEKDPSAIYAQSFATIREEAAEALGALPDDLEPVAVRLMHSVGMTDLVPDLRYSETAAQKGIAALKAGKPILVDTQMVAGGISKRFFRKEDGPLRNDILLTLNDPAVAEIARQKQTTRSAAAIELWRDQLDGAIVAIGNAPTALFYLLEMLRSGAPKPALVLGFPVGFVGAAESKEALVAAAPELELDYISLMGRRGGTPMASSAVNALAIMALGHHNQPL